jgi:hypothetical protein
MMTMLSDILRLAPAILLNPAGFPLSTRAFDRLSLSNSAALKSGHALRAAVA